MATATRDRGAPGMIVATGLSCLLGAAALAGQEVSGSRVVPTNQTVISGYGTAGYEYQTQGDNANAFTASISPIFLFQFQDRVLFEAELEFELQRGITETGLEYAQLDFLLSDNLTLVAGKFLLPFGVFGERLHPTWINKLPTAPPIYGHHVAGFGADPLMPILADIGVMARGAIRPGRWSLALNAYVTQGPAGEEAAPGELPEFEFPASSSDINGDKMIGGRLDIALPPWAEVNLSVLSGDYDETGVLDLTGWNVAAEARYAGFELRGEYLQTRQEIEVATGFPTLEREGFYSQLAYRWRQWEPVVRWAQVFDATLEGAVVSDGASQAAIGGSYWFNPSIALMAHYEVNNEMGPELDNDRLVLHLAFGF